MRARSPSRTTPAKPCPVMHACGHDIHMASWIGAASLLAQAKDRWHGTLVFVGQPAEEVLQGADLMIKDGLLTRFPKPDFVLGIHDTQLPPGRSGRHRPGTGLRRLQRRGHHVLR